MFKENNRQGYFRIQFQIHGLRTRPGLETGDQVKVIDGPLRGMVGSLVATAEGNRFMVALDSIGQSLRVTLEPNLIKKLS